MSEQKSVSERLLDGDIKLKSTEKLDKLIADGKIPPLTNLDKLRLLAQGFTLSSADEIAAYVTSLFSKKSYEQLLQEERDAIASAEKNYPVKSTAIKVAGAFIPGMVMAPFTGGVSIPATVGRMALTGAAGGAVEGFAGAEGDLKERAAKAGGGSLIGAVTGPVGGKVIEGAGTAITGISNFLRKIFQGRLSNEVEGELIRIVQQTNIAPEDLIERVGQGEIIPDMSEEAAKAVRELYAKGGRDVIGKSLRRRERELTEGMASQLQEDLAGTGGNITRMVLQKEKQLKAQESAAYKKVFKANPTVDPNISLAVEEILNINPSLAKEIKKEISLAKLPPLFKMVNKKLVLLRSPDLQTAEIMRRLLAASAEPMAGPKSSTRKLYSDLEKELRTVIDNFSPELAATRANWSNIMKSKKAFEEGRKAFGKTAEDLEIQFEDLIAAGNPDAIEAFRAGVATQIKNKLTLATGKSFIRNANDLNRKERIILAKIYPEDNLETALQKIKLAAQAQRSSGVVLGGSPTAITAEGTKKVGTGTAQIALDIRDALKGSIFAGVRLIGALIPARERQGLTESQLNKIAELLVTENADVLRRALTDEGVLASITNSLRTAVNLASRGGATATPVLVIEEAPFIKETYADDQDVQNIIKNMNQETTDKILRFQNVPFAP